MLGYFNKQFFKLVKSFFVILSVHRLALCPVAVAILGMVPEPSRQVQEAGEAAAEGPQLSRGHSLL